MSFILDALRKSDAERQRAATPGLADVRYTAARPRRNIWMPILVIVLLANAVFMGVQWLRKPGPTGPPTAAAGGPTAMAGGRTGAEVRPLARETGLPAAESADPAADGEQMEMPGNTPGEPPAEAPVVAESTEPRVTPPNAMVRVTPTPAPGRVEPPAATPATAGKSRISESNDLPTAERLIAGGTLKVPQLTLDLHVYSATPSARFVVINSRKYKEGGRLTEGPTVESITVDGVILAIDGTRFVLPRK